MRTAKQLSRNKEHSALRRLRLGYGFRLVDVAREVGIDGPHLSMLENGLRTPTVAVLSKLCAFYQVDIEHLFPQVPKALRKMEGRK